MAQASGSRFKLVYSQFGQWQHLRCPMANGNHQSWNDYLEKQVREQGESVILGQFRFGLDDLTYDYQRRGGNNLFRHGNFFGYFIKENGMQQCCVDLDEAEKEIANGSDTIYLFPIETEWGNLRYLVEDGIIVTDRDGNKHEYKREEIFTPQLIRLTQTGKFKIIITNIVDPAEAVMYYDVLDDILDKMGVPTEHIVWMNGSIPMTAFKTDRKSKSVHIDSILSLSQAAENYLRYPCRTSLEYDSDLVRPADLDINKKRSKRFLCFNRSLNRPYRIAMIYMALKHNLLNDSVFSFITSLSVDYIKEFLEPYLEEGENVDDYYQRIIDIVPYEIDTHHLNDQQKQSFTTVDNNRKDLYEDTYFHITAETRMGEEPSCFISEKTWRPILNLQPFIYFGGYKSLAKLHELGFKTFGNIIDESYDSELDPVKRFKMAEKEVVRLKNMTMAEIHDLYYSVTDILIHNQHLVSTYLSFDPLKELDQLK
jgi:hypothetical protein